MKKSLALLLFFVFIFLSLSGCADNNEEFTQKNYTAENGQISKINLDVRDRQIEVIASADNKICIDYYENSKEFYDILVSDKNSLTMTLKSDKNWSDYIGGMNRIESRKITLKLPDALLKELKISTTNEDILFPSQASATDIYLSCFGGNIAFKRIYAENSITVKAKNGNISGSILGNYDDFIITEDIKKGNSNLPAGKDNGTKTLDVSNNNGDINIEFTGV